MHTEKILQLTRRILRNANIGGSRYVFLQEMSRILIDYIQCDALEMYYHDKDFRFYWQYAKYPEPKTVYSGFLSSEFDFAQFPGLHNTPFEKLCQFVYADDYDTTLNCFTKKGSFWTNNIEEIPAELSKKLFDEKAGETEIDIYKSLAIMPIRIEVNNNGIFILKKFTSGFFTVNDIHFFESVVQTIGLALSDRNAQAALRERVKELTCLYGIAQINKMANLPLDQKLNRLVNMLPPSWQYPDIASARIVIDEQVYKTAGFRDGFVSQGSCIFVKGENRGFVEVTYSIEKPEFKEEPFLKEEVNLIEEVAHQIGEMVERDETEKERKRLQDQLRHADRLATIGQLAAGVAHELNEPLGSILGFAQLSKKMDELPEQTSSDLDKIISASLHAREIVKKLLFFAKQVPVKMTKVKINFVIEEVLTFFKTRFMHDNVRLTTNFTSGLPLIVADSSQISQVIVNLVVNAKQAMPKGGMLTIATYREDNYVVFTVEDTGVGMTEEIRKQIFIPFFSTKKFNEGTGLGLSVTHGIITSHNGKIEVQTKIDKGSIFKVYLPVKQPRNWSVN